MIIVHACAWVVMRNSTFIWLKETSIKYIATYTIIAIYILNIIVVGLAVGKYHKNCGHACS